MEAPPKGVLCVVQGKQVGRTEIPLLNSNAVKAMLVTDCLIGSEMDSAVAGDG
jgi:hypothetical protein